MPPTATMDSAKCNVIYVDRNARENTSLYSSTENDISAITGTSEAASELRDNLDLLVNAFGEGMCSKRQLC